MLTCITLISCAATTFAAPSENNDQAARKADMLKKFDKDGDGKLSDAEKTALRAEMQNRQGGKDRRQWTPEQRAETLKKFDKDGNGELSVDERNAAREAMKASRSEGEKRQGKKN
jgi:Ca2+-binding EF-hand superfamily protein